VIALIYCNIPRLTFSVLFVINQGRAKGFRGTGTKIRTSSVSFLRRIYIYCSAKGQKIEK